MNTSLSTRLDDLAQAGRVRVLAYGSSNTERHIPGMHWLDCVQLGFREKYGSVGHFLNTGICGETSRDLLERFETDAAFFRPQVAFLTIGGNDAARLSRDEFAANLHALWERFDALGTHVIFQTYYAPDSDGSEYFLNYYRLADIVRETAERTGSSLVDNLARWEPLRLHRHELYAPLMRDPMHLTERGNKAYGFDIARALGCPVRTDEDPAYWAEPVLIQQTMDTLAASPATASRA